MTKLSGPAEKAESKSEPPQTAGCVKGKQATA
jgi:hypothetical protein